MINRSFIYLKSTSFRQFFLLLSFRLLPFVQSTYLPNDQNDNQSLSDLSTLESMQNDVYYQNRDYFLNHINQLNANYDRRNHQDHRNHQDRRDHQDHQDHQDNQFNAYAFRHNKSAYVDRPTNVLTKRIALLANLFGNSEEEKKLEKSSENQTDSKSSELKKENTTIIENLNKNSNQSSFLKNHQSDREIETLNRLLNFPKNYENWQDHLKNQNALNNHRQDFINLLHLNNTNFADFFSASTHNSTGEQDQTKSKNLIIFSPEAYPSKSLLVENNNQFGFKPNNLVSSFLVNNDHHDYFHRANQGETMTEASDLNSEYDEESNKDEEDKQIDNRNENGYRRKNLNNRIRANGHLRQKTNKNKMKKNFDDQFSRNPQNSGFRPISMDKLLKEQSQINASTGVKRNPIGKNNKQATDTNQSENNSKVKRVNLNSTTISNTTPDSEYNQLSVGNQPFLLKPHDYRPNNYYGKRLINEILNQSHNNRKSLVSSNNKNVVINTATPTIESTTSTTSIDQLDDENNEQAKEDVLNEHDKQLITDKTKELFEKNDESSDFQLNDYETNKDNDLKSNNDLINTQHQLSYNQAVDAGLLNQQQQMANQAELDSSENDSTENENDLNNSISQSVNQTKESDLDSNSKAKLMLNELNKATKRDKNQLGLKSKQQQNKKDGLKQLLNSNYKYYKIYDKYSKLNGLNGLNGLNPNINFEQNYPMNAYLSNENFKINLNNGKSELDDEITMNNLIPYPTSQYNKQNSFSNLYYPFIKKKPFYSSYPNYGFSMNPLNGMLFDKLNIPLDTYSPVEKLSPLNGPIKTLDKNNLDSKFYNLDNKLHHLNSKYSLNTLTPPYTLPLPHLDAKYYEPKGHYDSKYHSIGNWQSGLAGFLLGVVPFSLMMASMVPTISAISSGGAAAAALGRRRRSVEESSDMKRAENRTINQIESSNCLIRLSKIIESINNLIQVKEMPNQMDTKIYFDQLIQLQRECEFNISLPIDFNERIRRFLNLKTDNSNREWRKESNSFYLYDINGGKFSWLDSIFNFFTNILSNSDQDYQFRLNNTENYDRLDYQTQNDQVFSIFHFKEMKCLQETVCKVLLSPNFKKSFFSNVASILASM